MPGRPAGILFPCRRSGQEIRSALQSGEEGWGRLKASAQVGSSTWETAIWFDTKANTYLLPLKTDIRKKEKLATGQTINVIVWI
ncbi:MAG: DUF1905 domain-containing protein [Chitinophagaceae bacterium]|nr:DUF1905 domain-containing protein [Chitinophagaceae bacterium]